VIPTPPCSGIRGEIMYALIKGCQRRVVTGETLKCPDLPGFVGLFRTGCDYSR
jgi:hypothetical protein